MTNRFRALTSRFRPMGWVLALIAGVSGLIVGCSADNGANPGATSGLDDGQFVRVLEPGNASSGLIGGTLNVVDGVTESVIEVSKIVVPRRSATITNGRYTMVVPAGALTTVTAFKISQDPTSGAIVCVLEPHATDFRTPVEVHFDLSGTDAYLHDDVRAQWFDETDQTWKDVESVWDPTTQTLIGYYPHFCSGRAGW